MNRLSRRAFWIAGICAFLSGEIALAQSQAVALFEVKTVEATSERVFFGRVRARQTVDLAFQVGGQILQLPIEEGQPVKAGDLIAQLDLEPFELGLARAQAQLKQAEDDFERLNSLGRNVVSQVSVDDAETTLSLNRISVQDAERDLRLTTLQAPFDGIVAQRKVPNFSTISPGTSIVRLHDMSDLRVEIEVPEVLFQRAGRDPDVQVQVEFAANDQRYDLEFREVVAETTQIGQAFKLTLGMSPPDDLFVLPGASATVFTRLRDEAAPLIIPSSALVFDPSGAPSVMVFEPTGAESGIVRRQTVTIVPSGDGSMQIIEGLQGGEEIVAAGGSLLSDGDAVERFLGFSR